jgi:hypothetical protein
MNLFWTLTTISHNPLRYMICKLLIYITTNQSTELRVYQIWLIYLLFSKYYCTPMKLNHILKDANCIYSHYFNIKMHYFNTHILYYNNENNVCLSTKHNKKQELPQKCECIKSIKINKNNFHCEYSSMSLLFRIIWCVCT